MPLALLSLQKYYPLYYRMNLTSIYGYIEQRLGMYSYKTAATFLISRTIGSAFRLYLVVIVLQRFVFDFYGIPFAMTVLISLALIFAYTYRGGLKRSLSPILYKHFSSYSVFLTIVFICNSLDFSAIEAFEAVKTATTLKYSFEDFISSKFHCKTDRGWNICYHRHGRFGSGFNAEKFVVPPLAKLKKTCSLYRIFVVINIFFLSVGFTLYLCS
jgi:hypothetical protein